MQTKAITLSLSALIVAAGALLVMFGSITFGTGQTDTEVQVEIISGDVSIYATGAFDFGQYTVSTTDQTVTGVFLDYFSVEDLAGLYSGYYTTVQLSGDLIGPGGAVIPATGISMSTTTTGVDLIAGVANPRVLVSASMLAFQSLDTARTLIYRDPANNFGVVGQYGTLPNMEIDIPAFSAVGIYTGSLVYTLYEN